MTSAPVMIRNTQPGPTVYSGPTQHVEWAGAGDPMGGDVQPVPPSFVDDVQFRRAVTRGIFRIEEAPDEIQAALAAHAREWSLRNEHARTASQESLEALPDKDVLSLACIGPSPRGTGICEQAVPVKARARYERPPLCPQHEHLTGSFLPEETGRLIAGKPEIAWMRTSLGARATQD